MWTDEWVMSKCTQDSQKVSTKLLSLPDNAKKLNFSPSAKMKICTPRFDPPPVWPRHILNTHKTNKSTGQNTYLTSKAAILAMLAYKKYSILLRSYKPKMSVFYSTLARQLCDDTHLPGWLSTKPAQKKYWYSVELKIFTVVKSHWSLPHLGNKVGLPWIVNQADSAMND